MIILDTDHVSELYDPQSSRGAALVERLASADDDLATTIITVEEQMRGWLAIIHRLHDVRKQIPRYQDLLDLFDFFACWEILPFDRIAADEFVRLRSQRVRVATMDLKIASIALSRGALLLTRNLRDFRQVPGLDVGSWLD